ncbi:MAG TPA: phosphate ABC transporter permease subunit PstC [Thermoplasmata archaeon]|nr:phosphate ABC transporter permease subunit PstC [Thermoplasmata archaeon]
MAFGLKLPFGKRRPSPGASLGDAFFHWGTGASAVILLTFLGLIVAVMIGVSRDTLGQYGFGFLGGTNWDPGHNVYGALPFIFGTLATSAIALVLGVPISLGIAIFASEIAPPFIRTPLTYLVELLAAIPSVVYGLWGIYVLVPLMADTVEPWLKSNLGSLPLFQGPAYGYGLLTAGIILAIMIIPTVSAVTRESLLAVPQSQREAALSLGATRWETTRLAVLKYARSGFFGAVMLGFARAFGETMAVTMVIGNSNSIPSSLFAPAQTLASLIANNAREALGLELSAVLEIALVLLALDLVINIFARIMIWRFLGARQGVA